MNPLMPPRSVMLKLIRLAAWIDAAAQDGSRAGAMVNDPEIQTWLAEARKRELAEALSS